jgi:hypothetical protein
MLRRIPATCLGLATMLSALSPGEATAQSASFVHTVTVENRGCENRCTFLDHPIAPVANLLGLVTSNWNAGGGPGVYYDSPVGLLYAGPEFELAIGGNAEMPVGARFNVWLRWGAAPCVGVHVALTSNIADYVTYLDRPSLNGVPGAFVLFSQRKHAGDLRNQTLYYEAVSGRWGIVNMGGAPPMEVGDYFDVVDWSCDSGFAFGTRHTATAANTSGHVTYIAANGLNGNPRARLLVSQNGNSPGSPYVENPHPIGVFYNLTLERWAIFNQDGAAIPLGADFNVGAVGTIFASGFESGDFSNWAEVVP